MDQKITAPSDGEIAVKYNIRWLGNLSESELSRELAELGADLKASKIIIKKITHLNFVICDLEEYMANIIKMEMLSVGGESALQNDVYYLKRKKTSVILSGNIGQIQRIKKKLGAYGPEFVIVVKELEAVVSSVLLRPRYFRAVSKKFDLSKKILIMGILNTTPDSFYDGGRYLSSGSALKRAEEMITSGADIIDVGGESTRPGSSSVTAREEIKRTAHIIKEITDIHKVAVSIDTSKWQVAEEALAAGAIIINDVTGFKNRSMIKLAASSGCGCIAMHMQGDPKTMQKAPSYSDVTSNIIDALRRSTEKMELSGIGRDAICIDPGIGFGKTLDHNLKILKDLKEFSSLPYPLAIGTSRKAFIGKLIGSDSDDRLAGSLASYVSAMRGGASILRVHDVKEAARAAIMTKAILDA